mgnify:CR=1 FL=1
MNKRNHSSKDSYNHSFLQPIILGSLGFLFIGLSFTSNSNADSFNSTTSFSSLSSWFSNSSSIIQTKPLRIENLQSYTGLYLTVYYAKSAPMGFVIQTSDIHLENVKAKQTILIDKSRINSDGQLSVDIPSLEIKKDGFGDGGYNVVIFVIHKLPNFQWVNTLDNSSPEGQQVFPLQKSIAMSYLTKSEVNDLSIASNTDFKTFEFEIR